jgi:peptidoglycan/LPS O-acetylase OafA/YrhL
MAGLGNTATATAGPASARTLRYRPHLDGLRTVAVYLVVAYHAGLGLFSGGYIGVDIFFVLSGYLVTQILVRDLGTTGHVRGGQFYARRVRRILPAAITTLVVTAVVYSIVASPAEVLDSLGAFKAAFLYVTNWYFIHQENDYFAANVNGNPVLQFWSLAIEEQFYLVWPMLLAGLYLVTAKLRRQWWVLRTLVLVGAVASMALALSLAQTNVARAYYGTDTRAYQLLFGAALALTPQVLRLGERWERLSRWTSIATLVVLVALATSLFSFGPISRGVAVAALALALLIALENARGGVSKQLLSSRPFTYLGRISFGVYLWHWPVIVIAGYQRDLSPIELFVISVVLATILAALSYRFIEHPIRMSRALNRYKAPVIAVGFGSSILIGLLVMPVILDAGETSVAASPGATRSPSGLRLLDWRVAINDIPALPDCIDQPVSECTITHGDGLKVLIMGDSNSRMWIPTFQEIAKQQDWTLSVAAYPTCPWERGLEVIYKSTVACKAHKLDWYERVIPQLDPDLILVSHQAFDNPTRPYPFVAPDGHRIDPGDADYESTLRQAAASSLRDLARPGRDIVIIEPIPDPPDPKTNPLTCLSTGAPPRTCSFQANRKPWGLERFYREQAKRPGVGSIDPDRMMCPRWPTCDAVVGQIIVKRDTNHLTATYARSLAKDMADALAEQIGPLKRPEGSG